MFGEEKAFLPMTLDGALKDDMVLLKTGAFQYVEGATDEQGRSILIFHCSRLLDGLEDTRVEEDVMRVATYVGHAALENVACQKRGIICLLYPGPLKFRDVAGNDCARMLAESAYGAFPVRISACHFIRPPTFLMIFVWPILKLILPNRIMRRFIWQRGSDERLRKTFSKYGINEDNLPTLVGGNFDHDHIAWLEKRRLMKK